MSGEVVALGMGTSKSCESENRDEYFGSRYHKERGPRVLFQLIKSKREREGQRGQDTDKNVSKLGLLLVVKARACTIHTAHLLTC